MRAKKKFFMSYDGLRRDFKWNQLKIEVLTKFLRLKSNRWTKSGKAKNK